MIPKILHYVWLGGNELPALERKCIESWSKTNPEYTIIRWDESNLNIKDPAYMKAYKNKKWAFCADIARLEVLYEYGGIYLDTDMELIKSLDPLLKNGCFIGKEDAVKISAGIIGATKNHVYIKDCLSEVKSALLDSYTPIPKILTYVYEKGVYDIIVYDCDYFYPYNPFHSDIKQFLYCDVTSNTFSIHHWSFSWKPSIIIRVLNKAKRLIIKGKYK